MVLETSTRRYQHASHTSGPSGVKRAATNGLTINAVVKGSKEKGKRKNPTDNQIQQIRAGRVHTQQPHRKFFKLPKIFFRDIVVLAFRLQWR
jgi:hypothetical protein